MKLKILIILLLVSLGISAQHNSSYSQYMFNALLLNPAYAGSNDALNLTALYRKQWLGLDGAPTTISFSAHTPLKNKKISVGLTLTDDKFGVSEHTKTNAIYAYRIPFLNGALAFGLQGGMDIYQSNWGQVRTTQQRDPSFTVNAQRQILPQAGFGMYYHTRGLYLGASIPSLLNQDQSKYETALFHAGGVIGVSEDIKIKPAVLVRYIRSSPLDINLSTTFYYQTVLGVGLGYSLNGAAMAFMDLRINDQFRLGYAYDYTFNALRSYNTGSHEVMLRYLFHYKVNVSSARYF